MSKVANGKALWFLGRACRDFCAVGGCASSPSSTTGQPAAITVELNISSGSVQTSGTMQFTATVKNSSNTAVTWQVNGVVGGNATVGTIVNGVYTAPATVPTPPTVTVLAIALADSSKSASAQITITAAAAAVSVSVSPTTFSVVAPRSKNRLPPR